MRYLLAAMLFCAIGAPAASALPSAAPGALSLSKTDLFQQVAKRGGAPKQQQAKKSKESKGSSSASSGIHPLVGSGEY